MTHTQYLYDQDAGDFYLYVNDTLELVVSYTKSHVGLDLVAALDARAWFLTWCDSHGVKVAPR